MGRFGTQVRGVYGEGAENFGSLYQISNQKTLGQTEREIIDIVRKAALELDVQERRMRKEYSRRKPVQAADECYKSYGVLKYARRLTRKDGMEFLSQIMTGNHRRDPDGEGAVLRLWSDAGNSTGESFESFGSSA